MISFVKGELVEIFEDTIVLENNGIGYNIRVPASLFAAVGTIGETLKIYTYLQVKEDDLSLFGFLTREDLNIFKMLLNVNGIGPKGALAILSTITPDDLRFAVLSDDVKRISSAPGIGTKTAQKLIIELKDKLNLKEIFEGSLQRRRNTNDNSVMLARNDAVEALAALGYGSAEALKAVKQVEDAEHKDSETILKEALKKLAMF